MSAEYLAETASRVAALNWEDRQAVSRVLGVLRQTDMTAPRVKVAIDIVRAVRARTESEEPAIPAAARELMERVGAMSDDEYQEFAAEGVRQVVDDEINGVSR